MMVDPTPTVGLNLRSARSLAHQHAVVAERVASLQGRGVTPTRGACMRGVRRAAREPPGALNLRQSESRPTGSPGREGASAAASAKAGRARTPGSLPGMPKTS